MRGDGDDGAGPEQQHCVGIVCSDNQIWNKRSDYYVRPGNPPIERNLLPLAMIS